MTWVRYDSWKGKIKRFHQSLHVSSHSRVSTCMSCFSPVKFFVFVRCCCGRLMVEHSWQESLPPTSLYPGSGEEQNWSIELHTKASPTNAFGTIDFQDTAARVCRAKVCKICPPYMRLYYNIKQLCPCFYSMFVWLWILSQKHYSS